MKNNQNNRFTLLPLDRPGVVTSFYAYEGGPARNALLAAMALQLADQPSQSPVLMIDWDLESPALHGHAAPDAHEDGDAQAEPPGLLEYFSALRDELRRHPGARDADALADAVLDAVDWQHYIERADGRRPLYLMRAGRFDAAYAERAGRLDWHALFDACPALFRRFATRMAGHFRHVLVAGRAGRSPAVSVCTTLVPDRLVGLFTPAPGSLDGLEGVVRRAIDYRCTHEDEQRPLLVYPLACAADGARSDPGQRWRRGEAGPGLRGYQARVEALLRGAYGMSRMRLDSWFDELQLSLCDAIAIGGAGLARPAARLLCWFGHGYFPWQSLEEVRLRLAVARQDSGDGARAADLARLGALCREEGRAAQADELLQQSLALRRSALGEDHAEARAGLRALAALHHADGRLQDARRDYELLAQGCARSVGAEHPDTLAARSRLACVLGQLGEGERALALHEQVVATCERLWGELHATTLDSLEDLALTLAGQQESDRARILYERVLDARRRLQGGEHGDTLRCCQQLAQLLGKMGDLGNARRLLERVVRARVRHDGPDAADTSWAREALAGILEAQGDLAAVRQIQESLPRMRASQPGAPASDDAAFDAHHPDRPARSTAHPALDGLQHELAELQNLIDSRSPREARALADRLRPSVMRESVAHPLRQRGAEMIKQVYRQEGDKDALLDLLEDQVLSLKGALFGGERGGPPALR